MTEASGEPPWPIAMHSGYLESPLHEPINLHAGPLVYEGPVVFEPDPVCLQGDGQVRLEFLPSPHIRFGMEVASQEPSAGLQSQGELTLPLLGCSAPAFVATRHISSDAPTTAEGRLDGPVVRDLPAAAYSARFHLLNFASFVGEGIGNGRETGDGLHMWAGRAELRFGDWVAILDAPSCGSERWQQAQSIRGYAITHVGDLRRNDARPFGREEASDAFDFLHWALSFANGARCGCVLRTGLGPDAEPVWEEWWVGQVTPAAFRQRWITDRPLGHSLSFASGFYDLWQAAASRDWLALAVGLYVASNCETTPEIGLVTAQVALELLASAVLGKPGVEPTGNAHQRIRALLSKCGVSLAVPPTLRDIGATFPPPNVLDGPEAAVCIRNRLCHPTEANRRKRASVAGSAVYQAAQLSLWYVELVLLWLSGYRGRHYNRTNYPTRGITSELVPWA